MKRRALITGITGQDGSYMAEWLLEKDYEVYGFIRRTSSTGTWRIAGCLDHLRLLPGDLTDVGSLERALQLSAPQEIYHFAAQSYVPQSFDAPLHTLEVTGLGAIKLFEAVRQICPVAKVYYAASSEQFGRTEVSPQTETTPMHPVSPYGCAKLLAYQVAQFYREAYDLFLTCGIAYNHESPRRGEDFVTRKITRAIAQIRAGRQQQLPLGLLSSRRDWSHAKDVVRGAWLSLQLPVPDDFLWASGVSHSVQEFVELAFAAAGLHWQKHVVQAPAHRRPVDIGDLCGDAAKARRILGWQPAVAFEQLIQEMVDADLAACGFGHPVSSERSAPSLASLGLDRPSGVS